MLVYAPPAFFWWWFHFDAYAPPMFVEDAYSASSGGFASIAVATDAVTRTPSRKQVSGALTAYGIHWNFARKRGIGL